MLLGARPRRTPPGPTLSPTPVAGAGAGAAGGAAAQPARSRGGGGGCALPAAAAAAAAAAAGAAGSRRRARRRQPAVARGALLDDLVLAADESLNTLEDAVLHATRIAPWLARAPEEREAARQQEGRRRVVVLGTGWAAHAISKVIDVSANDVCIVSPRNYFIFTPMLAAASVGTVEYRSILEHIRSANPVLQFIKGACQAVDVERREIVVRPAAAQGDGDGDGDPAEGTFTMPYDVLVVAVGVRPSSQGVPGVEENCLFLKEVEDARAIRQRVTECFELAGLPGKSEAEQRRLLSFVVVGGGPTGCEFCGELSDFVRNDLRRFYPQLAPLVRIMLLHRGKALLSSFGSDLQRAAREALEAQGIEVVTSAAVSRVDSGSLTVRRGGATEETIPCGLCAWAAGQRARGIVEDLRAQIPRQRELAAAHGPGPLYVDEWLRVLGVPDGSVLALGDCARVEGLAAPLPQTAQVAAQQGAYVARLLNRRYVLDVEGGPEWPQLPPDADVFQQLRAFLFNQAAAPPFRFLDLGRLAYLGENQAVAEVSLGTTAVSQASGRAAFVLWRSVYLVKQVSLRNRVLVAFDWLKSRAFGRDLTRF